MAAQVHFLAYWAAPTNLPCASTFFPGRLSGIQPSPGHGVHILFVNPPISFFARLAREKGSRLKVAIATHDSKVNRDAMTLLGMLSRVRKVVAEVDTLAA